MPTPISHYRTTRAIGAIIASVLALSLGDAVIKAAGLSLPIWQMYILRSALTVPVLFWLARRTGSCSASASGWVATRSALLVLMWLSYYVALPQMPLSLAAAAYYTGPIFILVISSLLARNWPSPRACIAIGAGFIGVLLVIRPDGSGFQIATLLPVLAAVLYACAMVLTSVKCRDENPFFLALSLNITFIVAGICLGLFSGRDGSFLLGAWQQVDLPLMGIVAGLACLMLIGSVGAAIAYQDGPPATVAAFDYSYLAFSLLWGAAFFGELPNAVSLAGILIIAGASFVALTGRTR